MRASTSAARRFQPPVAGVLLKAELAYRRKRPTKLHSSRRYPCRMRTLVALALVSVSAGSAALGAPAQRTSLTVTYWENGSAPARKTVRTLRCKPAGGTVDRPLRACQRLASGGRTLFAPLRKDMICTQIYGGPQAALVTGTLDGRRLWTRFQRRNGCDIERWNRVSPWLLPPGGAS